MRRYLLYLLERTMVSIHYTQTQGTVSNLTFDPRATNAETCYHGPSWRAGSMVWKARLRAEPPLRTPSDPPCRFFRAENGCYGM